MSEFFTVEKLSNYFDNSIKLQTSIKTKNDQWFKTKYT